MSLEFIFNSEILSVLRTLLSLGYTRWLVTLRVFERVFDKETKWRNLVLPEIKVVDIHCVLVFVCVCVCNAITGFPNPVRVSLPKYWVPSLLLFINNSHNLFESKKFHAYPRRYANLIQKPGTNAVACVNSKECKSSRDIKFQTSIQNVMLLTFNSEGYLPTL